MSFLMNLFKKKTKLVNMTICGLDNAGKTSIMNYLIYGEFKPTIPTYGVNVNTINLPKLTLQIHDLGGQEDFRNSIWSKINEKSEALIYIVDGTDHSRFNLTKNIFHEIINTQIDGDIPVLILLNKADLPNCLSRSEFILGMDLIGIKNKIQWNCYETSAKTGKGLIEAFTIFIQELEDSSL